MIPDNRKMTGTSRFQQSGFEARSPIAISRVLLSILLAAWVSSWAAASPAFAGPAVFWVSEPANPGDVVLLYGGGLAHIARASIKRFDDAQPGAPPGALSSATRRQHPTASAI